MTTNHGAIEQLGARTRRARVPTVVTFMVTDRCNYECVHCYQEHDQADGELPFDEVRRILGEVADAGTLFLVLMGGEFFMRRDADDILRAAHELGFAIRLKTTGHHVTDKRADLIASLRPIEVDLSLYAASRHVHEGVTRQPGSWERTVEAAKRLTARGVPVVLRNPVMQSNAGEVEGVTMLATELGCQRSFDPKIMGRQDTDLEPVSLRMDAAALRGFYDGQGPDLARQWAGYDAATGTVRGREMRPVDDAPCGAGTSGVAITSDGQVWPCTSLAMPVGDLRRQSFREVWSGGPDLDGLRGLRWAHISECNRCAVRAFCSRCHGSALHEHGDLQGPSLEACRHAVAVRDELRARGVVPADHTALPPTWDRVDADGQHQRRAPSDGKRRPAALRIIE
ncbi:MAG: radical SAM protein [Kofleriaceae bacterium]|nr:radical SAM protein [Myxococcales bacterium]MCB9559538.1 radical SAM protein [Kofleriaceae bacterium]